MDIFTLSAVIAIFGVAIVLIASFTPFPDWSKKKIKSYTTMLLLYYHCKRIERHGLIGKWLKCPNCLKIAKLELRDKELRAIIHTILGPGPWNECECFSKPWHEWDFNKLVIQSANEEPPLDYIELVQKLASSYTERTSHLNTASLNEHVLIPHRSSFGSSIAPKSGIEIVFHLPEGYRCLLDSYEIGTDKSGKLKYAIRIDDKLVVPTTYAFEHREKHPFI